MNTKDTPQRFIQIFINEEGINLPKQDGRYYCHFKTNNSLHKLKLWGFTKGANDYYWLRDIDWYLQPEPVQSAKEEVSDIDIANAANIHMKDTYSPITLRETFALLISFGKAFRDGQIKPSLDSDTPGKEENVK